jgi:broad specificity phosphatase PhoE
MIRPMPTILLVRHAQASFGASDYDALSSRGIEQADVLATDLARRGIRIDRIVSGTLNRQRDTAAPIAAAAGLPVTVDPRWNEYAADDIMGTYSRSSARLEHPASGAPQLTAAAFQDLLESALFAWVTAGAGTGTRETWPEFHDRANGALDDVADGLHRGQTALVCTSGGVLAAICVRLFAVPEAAFLTFNRVTANTGVTKVIYGRRGASLVSFNEHGHLEQFGESLVTYR